MTVGRGITVWPHRSMFCGHNTQCTELSLSVTGVLLPSGQGRLRRYCSSSVAVNRCVCLLTLAPSVNLTQNCHRSASENKLSYRLCCFHNALITCYLFNYMPTSAFEIAEIFKLNWLIEFSKHDL
jgi:hypothetical protein